MSMGRFLVERYLPDLAARDVDALLARIASAGPSMQERFGVRHIRSVVIPEDDACVCAYEAPDAEAVRLANDDAGLPVDRVVAANEHELPEG